MLMRTIAWRWPSPTRANVLATAGCWPPPCPTSARCCRSIRTCRKPPSQARTLRRLRTICRSARRSMRGCVHHTAEADVCALPAERHGAVIPGDIFPNILLKRFTANLVPMVLRPGRRIEFFCPRLLNVRFGFDLFVDELPHVAHHVQSSTRTFPLLEAVGPHDLLFRSRGIVIDVGFFRIFIVAPGKQRRVGLSLTLAFSGSLSSPQGNNRPCSPRAAFSHCLAEGRRCPAQLANSRASSMVTLTTG